MTKKARINTTIDMHAAIWVKTQEINISQILNEIINNLMQDQGKTSADEQQIIDEIEWHKKQKEKHTTAIITKTVQLAKIKDEREQAHKQLIAEKANAARIKQQFNRSVIDSGVMEGFFDN